MLHPSPPPPGGSRRFLIDQNITIDLLDALVGDGAYAAHTTIVELDTATDREVFRYVCERGLEIITDFGKGK